MRLRSILFVCLNVIVKIYSIQESSTSTWVDNSYSIPVSNNTHYLARCSICDALFDLEEYLNHTKNCRLEKSYKCEICGKEYNKEHNLKLHHLGQHDKAVLYQSR
ncbi:hypothetical protein WUBG_16076 [Wuchereria bancrofti]|uniref:C2H2-type domain-containing protein n=1 Tax=Wuchereria bancrofti TaxID=6293 RepID=J9DTN6_WUCBA|nr:hypothetical protein WUBG_16076 [Wuchereria bancrofti]